MFTKLTLPVSSLVSKSLLLGSSRKACPALYQAASITSKHFLDRSVKKPAPWPYKEKYYTALHSLLNLDPTLSRFDENTQLIVVEGNIGCGKTEFAKKLADEFEMLYMPEPSVESLYVDDEGNDFRLFDDLVPPSFKYCDLKRFYENPNGPNVCMFQLYMYLLRLEQYMDALAHLLNTGQGVVLERCSFSDFVFVQAMNKMGYLSKGVKDYLAEVRLNAHDHLRLKPTLVIYLDVDVNTLLARIKKRNIDYEVNSKVLSKEYLEAIEHFYKQDYLKYIQKYSELFVYDWSQYGDMDAVVQDIEKIDFSKYDRYEYRLKEWRNPEGAEWDEARIFFTRKRHKVFVDAGVPTVNVPEFHAPSGEIEQMEELVNKMPGFKYQKGFDPFKADLKTILRGKADNFWEGQKLKLFRGMCV